jgi:hypothetical protein
MVADGMLTRQRYREVPPRVDYELTDRARELAPVLGELARWGYEWTWGPPRASESVDPGAIFRLIPGLVGAGATAQGRVELTVSDGRAGEPVNYTITFVSGSASISERDQGKADAQIRGTTEAWIRALSPMGSRTGLRVTGNSALADAVFAVLSLSEGRNRASEPDSIAASA